MASCPPAVPLSDVVQVSVHAAHGGLLRLSQLLHATPMTDQQRRRALLDYLAHAQGLLLRLLVLTKWASTQLPRVEAGGQVLALLDRQQAEMRRAADELFWFHERLPNACAPAYDVRAAVDVLGRGTYSQLPLALESAKPPEPPADDARRDALRWLRGILRFRQASWQLPEGVTVREGRGCAICELPGEYEVALSTESAASDTPWRLLRLRLLVVGQAEQGGGAASGDGARPALGLPPRGLLPQRPARSPRQRAVLAARAPLAARERGTRARPRATLRSGAFHPQAARHAKPSPSRSAARRSARGRSWWARQTRHCATRPRSPCLRYTPGSIAAAPSSA